MMNERIVPDPKLQQMIKEYIEKDDAILINALLSDHEEIDLNVPMGPNANDVLPLWVAIDRKRMKTFFLFLNQAPKKLDLNQRYHDQSYLSHIIEQIGNDPENVQIYFQMIRVIIQANPDLLWSKYLDKLPSAHLQALQKKGIKNLQEIIDLILTEERRYFHKAIEDGDVGKCKKVLATNQIDLNAPLSNNKKSFPLCIAIDNGQVGIVKNILLFDIKKPKRLQKSYVHYLLANKDKPDTKTKLEILQLLIDKDPSVLQERYVGSTPLETATNSKADAEIIQYLQSAEKRYGIQNQAYQSDDELDEQKPLVKQIAMQSLLPFTFSDVYDVYAHQIKEFSTEDNKSFVEQFSNHLEKLSDYAKSPLFDPRSNKEDEKKVVFEFKGDPALQKTLLADNESPLCKTMDRYTLILTLMEYIKVRESEIKHTNIGKLNQDYSGFLSSFSLFGIGTFFNRIFGYSAKEKLDVAVKLTVGLFNNVKVELSDEEMKILKDARLGKETKPFRHVIEEYRIVPGKKVQSKF